MKDYTRVVNKTKSILITYDDLHNIKMNYNKHNTGAFNIF